MAHKCNSPDCEFSLTDTHPLDKCPWHMVPGRGPVKIAAALAVAAAGLGGGLAYKRYKTYLHEKQLRKEQTAPARCGRVRTGGRKSVLFVTELFQRLPNIQQRKRKTAATKSKTSVVSAPRASEPIGSRDCAPAVGMTQTLVNSCVISGLLSSELAKPSCHPAKFVSASRRNQHASRVCSPRPDHLSRSKLARCPHSLARYPCRLYLLCR